MQVARFHVSGDFLRQILHLPLGTSFYGAAYHVHEDVLELWVQHEELLDVPDNQLVPMCFPSWCFRNPPRVYHCVPDVIFIGWGQQL